MICFSITICDFLGSMVIFRGVTTNYYRTFMFVVPLKWGGVRVRFQSFLLWCDVLSKLLSWESKDTPPMQPPQEIRQSRNPFHIMFRFLHVVAVVFGNVEKRFVYFTFPKESSHPSRSSKI